MTESLKAASIICLISAELSAILSSGWITRSPRLFGLDADDENGATG